MIDESPAAWRGEELFSRPDWLYELTDADRDELDRVVREDAPLRNLGVHLDRVQHTLEHGSGAHLIRGLRVDDYSEDEIRRIFWSIATRLGTPVSQSASGEQIFCVRDEGYQIGQAEARGPNTRKSLSFHTDRCDVIAFLCVRQARQGGDNQIVSSVTVWEEIRQRRSDLAMLLTRPFYLARHNVDAGNEQPWCQQPIFSWHQGHFAGSYLRVLIDRAYAMPELPEMTEREREALDFVDEVASDPSLHVTFRQQPGDMLFLNNWVTFHRRDAFSDDDNEAVRDGSGGRLLFRIWLAVPNSRPLAPEFEANYGSTEAGAVRGGMRPLEQSQS